MKGSRTRRVCTLWMLLLVQRSSSQRSAAGRRLLAASSLSSCSFFFQTLNRGAQPVSNILFDLVSITVSVERIQRLTGYIERNVAAGNLFGAALRRHQLHQNTTTAR